jgi:glucose-6-phosphate 1-epimerase
MIGELEARFGIADVVRFEAGPGGLIRAVVTTASALGQVYLHGAHVTHYEPAGERPILFTSPRSRFVAGKAIRGGVPVIFPWFGPRAGHPTAPEHGFARVAEWVLDSVVRHDDGSVAVTLRLDSSDATRASWPHDFRLLHRIVFGPRLEMTLEVENRGRDAFSFEEALHTYLLVGDVRRATIAGLEGASFIDKTDGLTRKRLGDRPMRLDAATDRVFLDTRMPCTVDDPVFGRQLVVEKSGSATTVVWNPWSEKAAAMADLGADAWPSMLCVETANAADDAVALAPGARHRMTAVVSRRSHRTGF